MPGLSSDAAAGHDAIEANGDHVGRGDPADPGGLSLPGWAVSGTRADPSVSPAADALALPGFTYGLDIVLLVGRLHPCLASDGG